MVLVLLLLGADCRGPEAERATGGVRFPTDAQHGDEFVLTVTAAGSGDWAGEDSPGTVIQARIGEKLPRHVVIPGGVGVVTQRVALGAWDGEDIWIEVVAGDEAILEEAGALSLSVDSSAANTPVLGTYDDAWSNDTPLITYVEDDTWTWTFTDEDGGTGLVPTLLMATWGRPVDIEGLYDVAAGVIQTTDHAWVPFDGPFEGTHPLFEVVTYNGLIGPLDDAPFLLSPMPVPFDTDGGTIPRERVLDEEPWVLAAAWAEAEREGLVAPDGGQDDYLLGAPDEYVFVDYDVAGGARVVFEAEVAGAWWSSANGLSESGGATDARVSGLGRTCIELPPGAGPGDVTAIRVRSTDAAGTATARWFSYGADFVPVEMGAATDVAFTAAGASVFP